ncbi:hypothetical protein PQX77_004907 [Marasmius sp. AFHP31]|nr:hypothetical protein PQX77_004907 [Marasmius sp. AFHP31]
MASGDSSGMLHAASPTLIDNGTQDEGAQNERQAAQAPFDRADSADAIIETSDGVRFFTHKIILSLASPYFEEVFKGDSAAHAVSSKLDRHDPEGAENATVPIQSMTVYPIEENSQVFDAVLRHLYPGQAAPKLPKIDNLVPVLTAMVKYRMHSTAPFQLLTNSLVDIAKPLTTGDAHPAVIRVFALFHRFRDLVPVDSLNQVKRHSLHVPLEHLATGQCPELDKIPASALVELMKYHKTSQSVIRTHAPTFSTWHKGSSRLQYKCSSHKKSARREDLIGANVKDLYYSLIKTSEDCPAGLTNAISVATMLERGLKCGNCKYPCGGMRDALSKIFRNEVDTALGTVNAVCLLAFHTFFFYPNSFEKASLTGV